jgi:hypothetical protein
MESNNNKARYFTSRSFMERTRDQLVFEALEEDRRFIAYY